MVWNGTGNCILPAGNFSPLPNIKLQFHFVFQNAFQFDTDKLNDLTLVCLLACLPACSRAHTQSVVDDDVDA